MQHFRQSILTLITETSANLPSDVRRALAAAIDREDPLSQAGLAMSTISLNIDMAVDNIS
ncbi:MAG: fumarate hydratase, partial [Geobacteraceae bacterium]|nr:fumarate hydratase [Geobacteraceae bacterium]